MNHLKIIKFVEVLKKLLVKDYLSGVTMEDNNSPTFEVHKNPEKVYEK